MLGNPVRLKQMVNHLIENAIKYIGADNTSPQVALGWSKHGEEVRYEVHDNGLGIRESEQSKLFAMFSRAHTGAARGHGIGLSIVHRIVKRLGGEVGVYSELGKGSTFWFTLPQSDGDAG